MAKNKKQFGIWMDAHHAIILGREDIDKGQFMILAREENPVVEGNSNENTGSNAEKMLLAKFFKAISTHITNAEEIHVTGTGKAQEQFIHYLADTPQYKNTAAKESTAARMHDDELIRFVSEQFDPARAHS